MDPRRRRTWQTAGWTLAVTATILNGVVVGYGALWFQLFGSRADAEDYQVSAGGYAAAAAVLLLALPALLARGRSGRLPPVAAVAATVLGLLALRSGLSIAHAPGGPGHSSALDGVGGVLWAPWTWVMAVLGVRAWVRRPTVSRPSA